MSNSIWMLVIEVCNPITDNEPDRMAFYFHSRDDYQSAIVFCHRHEIKVIASESGSFRVDTFETAIKDITPYIPA